MNALVEFGNGAKTVVVANEKFGMSGERLLSASEYKKAKGLKGNAGKRAWNAYRIENGKVNNGEIGKQMLEGKLLMTGYRHYDKTGKWTVNFQETAKIVDPVDKAEPAKPVAIAEVFAGLTDEAKAAFIAQFIGKAA